MTEFEGSSKCDKEKFLAEHLGSLACILWAITPDTTPWGQFNFSLNCWRAACTITYRLGELRPLNWKEGTNCAWGIDRSFGQVKNCRSESQTPEPWKKEFYLIHLGSNPTSLNSCYYPSVTEEVAWMSVGLFMQIALTGIRAWQRFFHPGQDYFLLPGDSEGKIMIVATFVLHLSGNYSRSKVLLRV